MNDQRRRPRGKTIAILAGLGVVVVLGWTVSLYGQRYLAIFGGVRTFSPQPSLKDKTVSLMRGETDISEYLQHLSNYTGLYVRVDDENILQKRVEIVAPVRSISGEVIKGIAGHTSVGSRGCVPISVTTAGTVAADVNDEPPGLRKMGFEVTKIQDPDHHLDPQEVLSPCAWRV